MLEAKGVQCYQPAIGAEYFLHVFSNQVQRVELSITIIENAFGLVGSVTLHGDSACLPDHPAVSSSWDTRDPSLTQEA